MDDTARMLERFVTAYRSRAVPPPHILLVGPDNHRNYSVAKDFAERLGMKFLAKDAASVQTSGDLMAILWGNNLAFISNIQQLKKDLIEKLERDLQTGEWEVIIGQGPAARTHKMDLSQTVLIGTCPTKYDCPSQLLRLFEAVLTIQPPTNDELLEMLKQEASKTRISFDDDAGDLLLRASGGRSGQLLNQFRRICGVIDQIKNTNKPHLTHQEVADAMERLRIKIPQAISAAAALNLQSLSGPEFEWASRLNLRRRLATAASTSLPASTSRS